jgi:hypothetical protein
MSNKFNIGDRVILPTGSHSPSPEYPYQGSEFACAGEIIEVFIGSFSRERMAHIKWDNGRVTAVYTQQLRLENEGMDQTNPNVMFKLGKRTRHV